MAKRKLNSRFYALIVTAAVIIAVIVTVALLDPHEGETSSGSMELALSTSAVVVRDEVCVTGEKYGSIVFNVDEGEYVDVGAKIAQAYRLGYSNDIMQGYLSVQEGILAEQLSLQAGIENIELDSMNQQIAFKQRSILDSVMGSSMSDLLTLESELDYLLNQRIEYLRGIVQPNEALNALYAAETDRLNSLATWRGDIVATREGYISFYFDGYEQSLISSKLALITPDLVRNAVKDATKATDGTGTQFFRLYARDRWYLAFASAASSPVRLVVGQTYPVIVNGRSAEPLSGTAVAVNSSANGAVTVLEFTTDIGDLCDIRVVTLSINSTVSGIRVCADAITMVDGVAGITVISSDGDRRVEVTVLAKDDEYAIVQPLPGNTLTAGQRYSERG